jgi:hypothetical protein
MTSELLEEKKFYERFNALHRDEGLLRVFERFGIALFRRSSVLEGFDSFIRETGFSGRSCVEIGSCKGLTALVLARYFDRVVSIDIVADPQREEVARCAGVENVEFITVHDNAEKADVIRRLEFDGAYVDGDHARDTDTDFALVERCGQVLFHEFWAPQPPVVNLVNALKGRGMVTTRDKWALWRVR